MKFIATNVNRFYAVFIFCNENVKPYQKIDRNRDPVKIYEFQMPAYFMQYLAFVMETKIDIFGWDISGLGFVMAEFNMRYLPAKDMIFNNSNFIKSPHLLETYYLMTKKLTISDFK